MQGIWHCPISFLKFSLRLRRDIVAFIPFQQIYLLAFGRLLYFTTHKSHDSCILQVHVHCYTNTCHKQYPVCSLILYGQGGGKISVQALGRRGGQISVRAIGGGGLNFSARDFEKRANLPQPVNFDRSLKVWVFPSDI